IVDAYALCKAFYQRAPEGRIDLVVNNIQDDKETQEVHAKIGGAVQHFLKKNLSLLCSVVRDRAMLDAIRAQKPVLNLQPDAPVTQNIRNLARKIRHADGWAKGKGLSALFQGLNPF
ncbi:MAG: hypothetical protein KDC71_23110, partial [Acidobacteria bacterium]|nr:hypothetical protein [Acidobacteriota bacterium]